jgi:hypothetical protein
MLFWFTGVALLPVFVGIGRSLSCKSFVLLFFIAGTKGRHAPPMTLMTQMTHFFQQLFSGGYG